MLFPVSTLIKAQRELVCVKTGDIVSDALKLMIDHDYSQLPVVDANGALTGIVSEQSIARTFYHLNHKRSAQQPIIDILSIQVDHCLDTPATVEPESDLFEALASLRDRYSVIVTQNNKPVGILTDYDTTAFFRSLTEGLLYVQDVEEMLRQSITQTLAQPHTLAPAIIAAVGKDDNDSSKPKKAFTELNFGETIRIVTHPQNWANFQPMFGQLEIFDRLMNQVRVIRNQIAHFRGNTDPSQIDVLKRASHWLERRIRPSQPAKLATAPAATVASPTPASGGKYGRLQSYLSTVDRSESSIRLKFSNIESLLGSSLPPTAFEHRSWWANDSVGHVQSKAWLQAGWAVSDIDFDAKEVTFHRTQAPAAQVKATS